jgi:hypothetical protein
MGKGSWGREGGKVMSGKKSKVGFNIQCIAENLPPDFKCNNPTACREFLCSKVMKIGLFTEKSYAFRHTVTAILATNADMCEGLQVF